ncbi:MAG TPA: hypothetical protein VGL77_13735, partial [Armatimonadota bacterium]
HAFVTKYPADRLPDEYAWTTAVTPHAATAGVTRLFYGTTQLRWDDMYATPTMTFSDPAWNILVRGMPTSVAAKGVGYTAWLPQAGPKQPALAAVRSFGKGRLGVFTPSVHFTLWLPYSTLPSGTIYEMHVGKIDGTVLEKGDGTLRSDGRTLLTNIFRWLAEPARAAGMGGYTTERFAAVPKSVAVSVPDWVFSWRANNGAKWFKILVGARSAYSSGTGTVAEYADAARRAGVSLLIFTETFEKFNPDKWEQFLADCRRASDETLTVLPGLDIPDTYGARYLLLNSPLFPPAFQLTPDRKALEKVQYLCLTYPRGITVAHRVTTSPIPDQLLKHFQGISLYTYHKGVLEDNSMLTYQWQLFRYSNPLPFVVHEMDAPAEVEKEASNGQQLYGSADTVANLVWYFDEQGSSHYFESPVRLQVSDGPRITAFAGSPFLAAESDVPITEVSLYENYNLYRRWTPGTKTFTVDRVKLPQGHVSWLYAVVRDAKGRMAITPGMKSGNEIRFTARCSDRQNWFYFPNIYTGTLVEYFDIRIPTFGTDEGHGIFPQFSGPQRGDDMAAILDFPFSSPSVYLQDLFLDQRYYNATYADTGFDATPAHATTRSRVYEAKLRYAKFFLPNAVDQNLDQGFLPLLKEATIKLRMPVEPSGAVFPVVTTLDIRNADVRGDMSYAYTDPATGKPVTGFLKQGYLDLPKGGRVGGFIALSAGLRVSADGAVGFVPPRSNGALPIGTSWHALFTTVEPKEAEMWRARMGFSAQIPFTLTTTQGKVADLAYVATCQAENYGLTGNVASAQATSYTLPLVVRGVNYNWEAGTWRPGHDPEEIGVFEGNAWARVDVGKAGEFYVGNLVLASEPDLRLSIIRWTADTLELEAHNPTDRTITATITNAAAIRDHLQVKREITLAAGSSQILTLTKP